MVFTSENKWSRTELAFPKKKSITFHSRSIPVDSKTDVVIKSICPIAHDDKLFFRPSGIRMTFHKRVASALFRSDLLISRLIQQNRYFWVEIFTVCLIQKQIKETNSPYSMSEICNFHYWSNMSSYGSDAMHNPCTHKRCYLYVCMYVCSLSEYIVS